MREFNINVFEKDSNIIYTPGFVQGEYDVVIGGQVLHGTFEREYEGESLNITFLVNGKEHTGFESELIYNYVQDMIEQGV